MRTKTIEKAPLKMLIEALKGERTFEEIDRLDSIAEKEWLILYQSVKSEECDCVYWNDAPVTSQSGSSALAYWRLLIFFLYLLHAAIYCVPDGFRQILKTWNDSEEVGRNQSSKCIGIYFQ